MFPPGSVCFPVWACLPRPSRPGRGWASGCVFADAVVDILYERREPLVYSGAALHTFAKHMGTGCKPGCQASQTFPFPPLPSPPTLVPPSPPPPPPPPLSLETTEALASLAAG